MPKPPTPSQQRRIEHERERRKKQEQRRIEIARLNAVPIEDEEELANEVARLKQQWGIKQEL
jgi:hypothetical protein